MPTKRRGWGEGSIYRRADGQWTASVELGRDRQGKRRRRVVYGHTKRAVMAKLEAARLEKTHGLEPADSRLTVGVWLDTWLRDHCTELSPGSQATYRYAVESYLRPAVGTRKLVELTPADVEQITRGIRKRGLSANTAKLAHRVLRASLSVAERHGVVHRNVAALAAGPKRDDQAKTDDTLTAVQAQAVIEASSGHRLAALATVLLTLGLRQGEALGLRWDDINLGTPNPSDHSDRSIDVLDVGEGPRTEPVADPVTDPDVNPAAPQDHGQPSVAVRRTLSRITGQGLVLGPTKTTGSRGTIPLVEPALTALRDHRAAQQAERATAAVWEDDGIVFATPLGTYTDPRNALRIWQDWTVHAGLGKRRMHTSRHTCATLMLANGTPLEVVSAVLRHSSIRITADVYAHITADAKRQALRPAPA